MNLESATRPKNKTSQTKVVGVGFSSEQSLWEATEPKAAFLKHLSHVVIFEKRPKKAIQSILSGWNKMMGEGSFSVTYTYSKNSLAFPQLCLLPAGHTTRSHISLVVLCGLVTEFWPKKYEQKRCISLPGLPIKPCPAFSSMFSLFWGLKQMSMLEVKLWRMMDPQNGRTLNPFITNCRRNGDHSDTSVLHRNKLWLYSTHYIFGGYLL